MPLIYLIAGYDQTVTYERLDSDGESVRPTITGVSATLNGVSVGDLENEPWWDEEAEVHRLNLLGTEVPDPGPLVLSWSGTDEDGSEFTDHEELLVLVSDDPDAALVYRVRRFLRVEDDDPTVAPLVRAAQAYIANAGVSRPSRDNEPANAQYETAVSCYVSIVMSGGESDLDAVMTAILLQMRAEPASEEDESA
jgi:hypothetical protein